MKRCLVAVLALATLTAWKCEPKSPDNPQGLPRVVTVRLLPDYGVTETLTDPRAIGDQFDVHLVYIYLCGFRGLYRGPDGSCYAADGHTCECLDNGGKYNGAGVDRNGLCHEDWLPLAR